MKSASGRKAAFKEQRIHLGLDGFHAKHGYVNPFAAAVGTLQFSEEVALNRFVVLSPEHSQMVVLLAADVNGVFDRPFSKVFFPFLLWCLPMFLPW